jgi:hypothetical protein
VQSAPDKTATKSPTSPDAPDAPDGAYREEHIRDPVDNLSGNGAIPSSEASPAPPGDEDVDAAPDNERSWADADLVADVNQLAAENPTWSAAKVAKRLGIASKTARFILS